MGRKKGGAAQEHFWTKQEVEAALPDADHGKYRFCKLCFPEVKDLPVTLPKNPGQELDGC